ncbi:hypothetical protein COY87_04955 [Candidatus Roizmanbacteria bacterium CG_4_10_14_0_8_um_filter_33_9]|uniref:Radical SAM core domain-containing protein n=1 Tax=Candidatus Roizmanbacteria bacterium CG_4_10_14_0_8_um_filter_33_9 TaxID=1974826 RepID=A0A2M7QH60_9BACT|nr:MAG: hypothetical protein COY87_04955 [Candidatus Roizmanbacteria bacterium CG_4_10_14_0_8_um_filter_33_9]
MDYKKLIEIKAQLLCYGIRENKWSIEFYRKQNPNNIIKGGGFVGLHFILDTKIPVLASTTFVFDKNSSYEIVKKQQFFYLKHDDGSVIRIDSITMPHWYQNTTTSHKPMSKVFAHEGTHYLHQQYAGCGYQMIGKGCKFCGTGCKWYDSSAEEIVETALQAYEENNQYQVCLGGGTKLIPSKGSEFFLSCVKKIREKNKNIPIWIEMTPPDENKYIEELINAGASGFGFNIEIWDDVLRHEICPGKSRIPKQRYFEVWDFVQKKLDKNKTNTVLITKLEPFKSTLEGIHEISKKGVRITLLPFKPWGTSAYANKVPADPENLLKLGYKLAKDMIKYHINPDKNYGCANCDSCTIEEDIRKFVLLPKKN